jgi:predicted TPR repeat methyltransferase
MTALGRLDLATKAYRQWLALEPDSDSARYLLAGCTGEDVPDRAPDGFIREEFDPFAERFDENLAALDYRAPSLVAAALATTSLPRGGVLDILDVGCGTGLCGPHLRCWARRLTGVDLSAPMLERAVQRGGYDELVRAELGEYLTRSPASFDLIVAADTLVYFGDLLSVCRTAGNALRNDGHLVFTIEREPDGVAHGGFRLHVHGRYSHSREYLSATIATAGLEVLRLEEAQLRREGHTLVEGLVVVARRR